MENYDPAKIIVISMIGQSRMPILYPLFLKSWTRSKEPNSLPSLMSDGDTTRFESGKKINGKLPLKQIEDYLNQL